MFWRNKSLVTHGNQQGLATGNGASVAEWRRRYAEDTTGENPRQAICGLGTLVARWCVRLALSLSSFRRWHGWDGVSKRVRVPVSLTDDGVEPAAHLAHGKMEPAASLSHLFVAQFGTASMRADPSSLARWPAGQVSKLTFHPFQAELARRQHLACPTLLHQCEGNGDGIGVANSRYLLLLRDHAAAACRPFREAFWDSGIRRRV